MLWLMHTLLIFIIVTISKKDAVMDKVPKQPTAHTNTHTQQNQSSITIKAMTNDTLPRLGKRHLMKMTNRLRAVVYCGSLLKPTPDDVVV
jgi:biopolymer transport protein ExbD